MDLKPLVSVNLTTYNRARLLKRSLDSVLKQQYPNMEIIVVDDGSNDETLSLLSDYIKQDERIKLIRHDQNKGNAVARNSAFKASKGIYIAFMDDDDEWIDCHKLEIQVDILESNPRIGIVCSSVILVQVNNNKKEKLIQPPSNIISWILKRNGIIYSPTVLTRRTILEKVGGFDESIPKGVDSDFYRRCIINDNTEVEFILKITTAIHEYGSERMTDLNNKIKLRNEIISHLHTIKKFSYPFLIHPGAFLYRVQKILRAIVYYLLLCVFGKFF